MTDSVWTEISIYNVLKKKKKGKKRRHCKVFLLKFADILLVQIYVHSQVLKHYCALFHPAAFTLAPIAVKSEVHHICQKAACLTVSLHHLPLTIQFVVDWQHPDAAGVMNGLPCSRLTRLALYFLCKKKLIVIVIYGSYHQAVARNTAYAWNLLDGSSISRTTGLISLAWSGELWRASVSPLGMFKSSCSRG